MSSKQLNKEPPKNSPVQPPKDTEKITTLSVNLIDFDYRNRNHNNIGLAASEH